MSLGDRARSHILVERRPDLPARRLDGARDRAAVLHRIEPGRPGRALVEVDVLLGLLHLCEVDGRDFRGLLLHQEQRPPIEGFDHDAVGEVLTAQKIEHGGHETLRVERLFRVRRVDLGLDVQPHVSVLRATHQVENFSQRRDARSGYGELVGKSGGIVAAGADLADIVVLDLRQRQFHVGDAGADVLAVRAAGEIRIEPALVRHDDDPVLRDAHVELERVDAHRQGVGEGGQGVLRPQRASTAVRLEVERAEPRSVPGDARIGVGARYEEAQDEPRRIDSGSMHSCVSWDEGRSYRTKPQVTSRGTAGQW